MDSNGKPTSFRVDPEVEKKIDSLLLRMTLVEKIGQMTQRGTLKDSDREMIKEGRIGSFLNVRGAEEVNEIQRIAVEESRLGIPLIIGDDVIHGYRTTFPIPLAEASSWNLALMEETAAVAAMEASTDGIHWIFAPMVDIARDARWGRVAEGAGEDTYLGSEIARARVQGLQRNDWHDRPNVVACPKHFAAYGAAEAGRDYNTVDVSELRLRETYFPPFQAALDAGAGTMMAAFNDLNGVPCSGNRWLLMDILQKEWGFGGFVVSDWESIDELVQHGNSASRKEAGRTGANAGVHMDMHSRVYHEHLLDLVENGDVPEEIIDDAVRRILRVKFWLGLFDHPYTDSKLAESILLNPSHVETARQMARESIVLLKNEGDVLPLQKDISKLAVIGPLADDHSAILGCWAGQGRPEDAVSVLEGIRSVLDPSITILYEKGCEVNTALSEGISKAVDAVKQADLAIVVLGETAWMSGENNSRVSLDLPDVQSELLKAIHESGTPVVLVLVNGRPLSVSWAQDHVPAILEAWQLGIQAGTAIADVLFGEYNPSGKLPITFPRTVGQVPIYYNARKTGRPHMKRYVDCEYTPLYPFGYGLSYTRFSYSNLSLSSDQIKSDERLIVSVQIKNVGNRNGEEIVQLYIGDEAASITRPVKELKGFRKIFLKPGETKAVSFEITAGQLGFMNSNNEFVVEPGNFVVFVGPDSTEGLKGQFEVL